jgi:hypothetical protein
MMGRQIRQLILGALAWAVLAFSGTPATASDYDGPDGGHLIFSVGTLRIPMNFTFRYRSVAPAPGSSRPWNGVIECRCVGFFSARMANPDYTGHETGKVMTHRLPPGDYEIHDFGFGGTVGSSETTFSSGQRFVIPFTIRAGEATYIGNFARAPSLGTPLEPALGAKGFFVISDKSERDLAITRQRFPNMVQPTVSVTDVSGFNHPALRPSEP